MSVASLLGTDRRVVILALTRMTQAIGDSYLTIALPLYVASELTSGSTFGLETAFFIGVLLSITAVTSFASQPLVGYLSDLVARRKPFIMFGILSRAVSNALFIVLQAYPLLLLLRAYQGFGGSFTIPTTMALINEYAPESSRGGNMGIYFFIRFIGSVVGPITAGIVVSQGPYTVLGYSLNGFQMAFAIAAVGAFVSFVLIGLFVFDPPELKSEAGGWERPDLRLFADSDEVRHSHIRFDPIFVLFVGIVLFGLAIPDIGTIQPQINAHLNQSSAWFGLQIALFVAALLALSGPAGRLSDRYGRMPLIMLGWGLLIPSTALQAYADSPATFALMRIGQGTATAFAFAPAMALAGDVIEKRGTSESSQFAIVMMSFAVGSMVGPLIAGYFIRFGYVWPFLAGGAMAIVGAVVIGAQIEETNPHVIGRETSLYAIFLEDLRRVAMLPVRVPRLLALRFGGPAPDTRPQDSETDPDSDDD